MKMGSALFWGLLLIILGLSFIFRIVFNIDFPLFKIFIAFVFIFLGIRILFGSAGFFHIRSGDNDIIFGEKRYHHFENRDEFSVVFAKGVFDFRDFDLEGETKKIKISTVFGGTDIKLSKDIPVKISVDGAFAGAELPNGNSAVFGSSHYESPNYNKDEPHLYLKVDVAFGGINFRMY